jgi:hypothetical protein
MFFLFLTSLNLISSLSSLTFLNVSLSPARRPPLPRPASPAEPSAPIAAPVPGRPHPQPWPPPTRKPAPGRRRGCLRCARPPTRPPPIPWIAAYDAAWRSLCRYWASAEFKVKPMRHSSNRGTRVVSQVWR